MFYYIKFIQLFKLNAFLITYTNMKIKSFGISRKCAAMLQTGYAE